MTKLCKKRATNKSIQMIVKLHIIEHVHSAPLWIRILFFVFED